MDSKILEYAYGIKGVDILEITSIEGVLHIHIETKKNMLKCSECGSRYVIKKGSKTREFKDVPIGLMTVKLVAKVNRLECKNCGSIKQEKLTYAEKKSVYK